MATSKPSKFSNPETTKNNGRFKKGERRSPATEFKKGQHWRERKPYWGKDWLVAEYISKQRSAGDIAHEVGTTEEAIYYWLRKHKIPRRSVNEARQIKHWGAVGESNPMFGRRGPDAVNWRGGITPDRQRFYASIEWKRAFEMVWQRDGGLCRRCHTTGKGKKPLHVHHIVSFFAAPELRAELTNLVLLCNACHSWVHSKKNIEKIYIKEVQ